MSTTEGAAFCPQWKRHGLVRSAFSVCSAAARTTRGVSPKGGTLSPEDSKMPPLNWKLRLTGHAGLLAPQNQEAEKGGPVLTSRGIWAVSASTREVRTSESGSRRPPWGVSVSPRPVLKVSGNRQEPHPGRMADGPDPSGMEASVTTRSEARQRSCLLRAKGRRSG